jgi:hypothetical protein
MYNEPGKCSVAEPMMAPMIFGALVAASFASFLLGAEAGAPRTRRGAPE